MTTFNRDHGETFKALVDRIEKLEQQRDAMHAAILDVLNRINVAGEDASYAEAADYTRPRLLAALPKEDESESEIKLLKRD